jgi:DNA modification methylase
MAFHPITILVGDVLARLRELAPDSFDCVVTSPPYWQLRDYGVDGQIGLEPTLTEHIAVLVAVFEEVRRVLKPHGTLWINYGDCFATTPNGRPAAVGNALSSDDRTFRDKPGSTIGGGIKAKDLCMIPNRLAIALQDAGWWVRGECIWGKPNAMPDSSGAQRPAAAHEKIFMLSKSEDADVWRARDTGELSFMPDLTERCALITDPERQGPRWLRIGAFYDANAVLQGRVGDEDANTYRSGSYVGGDPGPRTVKGNKRVGKQAAIAAASPHAARSRRTEGFNARWDAAEARLKGNARAVGPRHDGHINHTGIANTPRGEGRFLRNYEPAHLQVWEIAIAPFKDAHFATFPPELAARCIRAGCPADGSVLDPFGGAGTTGLVAWRLQRACTLIELNPEYAEITRARLDADQGVWGDIRLHEAPAVEAGPDLEPISLFGDAA